MDRYELLFCLGNVLRPQQYSVHFLGRCRAAQKVGPDLRLRRIVLSLDIANGSRVAGALELLHSQRLLFRPVAMPMRRFRHGPPRRVAGRVDSGPIHKVYVRPLEGCHGLGDLCST